MASKKSIENFYKQYKLYQRRLTNLGKYQNVTGKKSHHDFIDELNSALSDIESGRADTKELRRLTKELESKKYSNLSKDFEMFDVETGEVKDFNYRTARELSNKIAEYNGDLDGLINYDTTLLNEVKIYLSKSPKGITEDLLNYLNELEGKFGQKELARRINDNEHKIPQLNKDTTYEEFKGMIDLFVWLDSFMTDFASLEDNNERITQQLESEFDSYE